MSSYKIKNTRERKEIQQEERKGKKPETIQLNKTKPKINEKRIPIWNQHTYDVGTWTKDKIEIELLLGKKSWSSIVSRTMKQNSFPCTITLSQASSLLLLSHNNYRKRRNRKDKVNEHIETMEKSSKNNASKEQIHHKK